MARLLTVLSLISLFGLHASINHGEFLKKCAHIPDGNYPIRECSHKYLACSGGRGIIRTCPSALVYDPVRNRCEIRADVPTCGISTVTTTPQSDVPSTTEQQTFDCSGLLPGDYPLRANSCLQQYFTCDANSIGVVRTCPEDLYFDSVNRVCNFFDNIASCSGATTSPTTVTTTSGPTLPPVDFDCSKKADGFYPNPDRACSSIYYACTAGQARRLLCGSGLAYDVVTRACQSPDNTFACTGRTTTVTTATTVTTQRSPVDCTTLANGLYPDPESECSRTFFVCSDGTADRFVCPGELFFDPTTQSCQRFNDIFVCTGATTTTTTTTSTTTATTPQSDVPLDCTSLADGLYPNPDNICSTFYFICSGSVATRQNCPTGLYYDPEIQRCNSFGNIFVCTGTRPTATTTTTAVTVTSSPELDCTNLANGLYPNPRSQCSAIYFYCTNGFTIQRTCLDDLFFNPELRICDRFSNIFQCTGTRSTPTTSPTPTTTPQSDVPFNCAYLPNGNYPNPSAECSNVFFTCSNGKASMRTCPSDTFFDSELQLCLAFEDVPACSGNTRTTTTATTTTALSDVTTPFFQCGSMPNGNYPLGPCENVYVSCVDGTPSLRECPPNLFYDYTIDECDYIYNIPSCGGERTTTALSDVTVTTSTPVPEFDCSRLADGKYPNPNSVCFSDFYYVCAGGLTSRMFCPAGLVYDPNVQECRFLRHTKPCKKHSHASS